MFLFPLCGFCTWCCVCGFLDPKSQTSFRCFVSSLIGLVEGSSWHGGCELMGAGHVVRRSDGELGRG